MKAHCSLIMVLFVSGCALAKIDSKKNGGSENQKAATAARKAIYLNVVTTLKNMKDQIASVRPIDPENSNHCVAFGFLEGLATGVEETIESSILEAKGLWDIPPETRLELAGARLGASPMITLHNSKCESDATISERLSALKSKIEKVNSLIEQLKNQTF